MGNKVKGKAKEPRAPDTARSNDGGFSASKAVPKAKKGISDELRQAVLDLGGGDEDFALIEGIDEDDDDIPEAKFKTDKGKGKGKAADEKELRAALGEMMKGMNFASVPIAAESESEDGSDTDEVDEDEEDHSIDDEDVSESEESESGEEAEEEDQSSATSSGDEEVEGTTGNSKDISKPSKTQQEPTASSSKRAETKAPTKKDTETATELDRDRTSGTNVPAAPIWPSLLPDLPAIDLPKLTPAKLNNLRQRATQFLENLPPLSRASSSSDAAFISQILHSGTHQDKLSALILLVRESPIHAVKELGRLRYMSGWKEDGLGGGGNKDQRVAVMKALADWWVTGGGKESGKLRYFADQPLLAHPQVTDRHLLVFGFEDFLKKWFFNLLQVLEFLSHDTLPYVRTQTLHIIFQLLSGNAEQEQNLLRLGVNKLGDTEKSVASKTSYHLLQLLQVHPAMKAIVAREVSALVLKPTTPQAEAAAQHVKFDDTGSTPASKMEGTNHARYYGLITLNQIPLTAKDQAVANNLVELYFEMFREILGNSDKNGESSKSAGLGESVEKVAGKVEKWRGRRKGAKPKGGRKAALESEETIESGETKVVAAILTGINRALPFANLEDAFMEGHMSTLFRITHKGTFNTSIQSLSLIFQVAKTKSSIADRFYGTLYDSLFDERLTTSSKQAMYLNLLFKAMKADTNSSRVMAFVKRLLQMLGMQQPPFICGALYLLGELFSVTPGLKRMLIEPEEDDEEHFVDADKTPVATPAEATASSSKMYDGRKRQPQYANADTSCLWELLPLTDHFHPSVSLQATQLLLSHPLTGSSDISLNTLVAFLDRFVYRNPKKNLQPKGASIMQPAAAGDKAGMIVQNKGARAGGDVGFVNTEAFWRKKIEDVPADQMFFHKFFSQKLAQQDAAKKKAKTGKDDEESEVGSAIDSDAEEDQVWKAMQATMPGADDNLGLSDDEDDLSMSDSEAEDLDDSDAEVDISDPDLDEEDEDEEAESADEEEEAQSDSASDSPFPDFGDEEDDIIADDDMPNVVLGNSPTPSPEPDAGAEKGKRKRNDERKERKKKRKEMPVFGSYEDYAKLIDEAGSGDDE